MTIKPGPPICTEKKICHIFNASLEILYNLRTRMVLIGADFPSITIYQVFTKYTKMT